MGLLEIFINSPVRLQIADFLNIILIQNSFIFINVWWLVHLVGWFLVALFLFKRKYPTDFIFKFVFGGAIIYEAVEFMFYTKLIPVLFIPEIVLDVVWDIIASLMAFGLAYWVSRK